MGNVSYLRKSINYRSHLPLFDWAEKRERRVSIPYPAKRLARRHGLDPERADLIARLAGWEER